MLCLVCKAVYRFCCFSLSGGYHNPVDLILTSLRYFLIHPMGTLLLTNQSCFPHRAQLAAGCWKVGDTCRPEYDIIWLGWCLGAKVKIKDDNWGYLYDLRNHHIMAICYGPVHPPEVVCWLSSTDLASWPRSSYKGWLTVIIHHN